jgi:hypothetical protein
MRKHLTFANVMSVIAVCIALGGTAYAANKISGKSIKNGTISKKKLKANVLKGLDTCPANAPTNLGGICYGSAQAATNWDSAAQQGCRPQGLRLPTIGEGLLIMTAIGGGASNETWTDEVTDLSAPGRAFIKAPGDPSGQIFSAAPGTSHSYRCVATSPRRRTTGRGPRRCPGSRSRARSG